jgi:Putative Tad-like Flp pilus-assembly
MKNYLHRCSARGQVLVFVAIAIVALLATLALATDVAIFYFNWAQLRKEVDAAALAGASYLPANPTTATSTATTWVGINGKPNDQIIENSIGSLGVNNLPNSSITVSVRRTVPYYFARVVGLVSAPITVTATAGAEPISGALGWLPIAMPCKGPSCYNDSSCKKNSDGTGCYTCGGQATLNTQQLVPGDWGPIACPSANPGDNGYVEALTNGCSSNTRVGDMLYSKPGNPVHTQQGIDARLSLCGSSCDSNPPSDPCGIDPTLDPGNPRMVLLPLVDTSQWQAGRSSPGTVWGFVVAWILSAQGHTVTVEFLSSSISTSATPDPTGPLTGAYAPVLLK